MDNSCNLEKDILVEFGTWLSEKYLGNTYQDGQHTPLPKGLMRKRFTLDIYSMDQIVDEYSNSKF